MPGLRRARIRREALGEETIEPLRRFLRSVPLQEAGGLIEQTRGEGMGRETGEELSPEGHGGLHRPASDPQPPFLQPSLRPAGGLRVIADQGVEMSVGGLQVPQVPITEGGLVVDVPVVRVGGDPALEGLDSREALPGGGVDPAPQIIRHRDPCLHQADQGVVGGKGIGSLPDQPLEPGVALRGLAGGEKHLGRPPFDIRAVGAVSGESQDGLILLEGGRVGLEGLQGLRQPLPEGSLLAGVPGRGQGGPQLRRGGLQPARLLQGEGAAHPELHR
jgi:hypothetical protein